MLVPGGSSAAAFVSPLTSGFFQGRFFNDTNAGPTAVAKDAVGSFGFAQPGNVTAFGSFRVNR